MPEPVVRLPIGIEIARSGTVLTAGIGEPMTPRRLIARYPAPPDAETAVGLIEALIQRVMETHGGSAQASAVGIALAGGVDDHRGVVLALPQAPSWSDFPLAARLGDALGVPVRLTSAVRAAALAEAAFGGDAGVSPLLYVSLGRSVEGGIVVAGRVLAGAHGAAGRLGHVRVAEQGPRCSCGAIGHLDPIASSQAVVRAMIGRASDREESLTAMLRVTDGRAEAITAPQIVALASGGDPVAQAVVAEAQEALARGLAGAVALLDPARIVIAGPLAEAGPAFVEPLAARLHAICSAQAAALPALAPARLRAGATLTGALLLAAAGDHVA
jgi:glucokinase